MTAHATMSHRRFTRDADRACIGGVCAGFADYFSVDPVLVRLGFVLLAFANGIGVLFYIICWVIMPTNEEGVPGTDAHDINGLSSVRIDALDMSGAVVYALGCHGGLTVPGSGVGDADNSLDLPQTFLRRGAVAYVGNGEGSVFFEAVGYRQVLPTKKVAEKSTPYDLASITKAVATARTTNRIVRGPVCRIRCGPARQLARCRLIPVLSP